MKINFLWALIIFVLSLSFVGKNVNATASIERITLEPSLINVMNEVELVLEIIGIDSQQIDKANKIIASVNKSNLESVDSEKLFRINCSLCHGINGNMQIGGSKQLIKSGMQLNESVARIYFGKGMMMPYKGVLTNVEIIVLANYIEGFRK